MPFSGKRRSHPDRCVADRDVRCVACRVRVAKGDLSRPCEADCVSRMLPTFKGVVSIGYRGHPFFPWPGLRVGRIGYERDRFPSIEPGGLRAQRRGSPDFWRIVSISRTTWSGEPWSTIRRDPRGG